MKMSPFSFEGRMGRLAYASAAIAALVSQHFVVFVALRAYGIPERLDWLFFLMPLRQLIRVDHASVFSLIAGLAYFILSAWVLAALAFRRAADANISEWIAAAAVAPVVQIPVILFLCVARPRVAAIRESADSIGHVGWMAVAQGIVAGMGLTLFSVAVGALMFGAYGFGMFVVSPFVIGAMTAYFANHKSDLGGWRTAQVVLAATALGGVALIVAALEGIVCIVMASPLGFGIALIGGLLGRSVARYSKRSTKQAFSVLALLPLVFASEDALPLATSFETRETVTVSAPAHVVWQCIVRTGTIDEPPDLPFRLGVAYPISGEILGEGVGATRYGKFSTGIALERVTEWIPDRKLAFTVLQDVPAMRELSPYDHVHSPHVVGYFRTVLTSFELIQRSDGGTDIVERTTHELRLDPILYWLPMARWIVHENNARVLAHIRHQAETVSARAC